MKQLIYLLFVCCSFLLSYSAKGQTAAADNKISETVTFSEPPKGDNIYGVFEGRTPCFEIGKQLGTELRRDCHHLKWQVIFFRDPVTKKPTTYSFGSEMFDRRPLKGNWKIIKGTPSDPEAILFALEYGHQGKSLYILKGDDNVLFILDENREFRTGNEHYSYTLNRVKKVRQVAKP